MNEASKFRKLMENMDGNFRREITYEADMQKKIPWDAAEDIEVAGVDPRDYPDFSDAYIESAVWADSGKPMSEDELEVLQDSNPEEFYDYVYQSMI